MSKILTKRRKVIIAGASAALILGTGGAAYAYFTATGQGTGTATVGTAGTWSVAQSTNTPPVGTIYPGASTGTVITFDVTNTSTTANQAITKPTVKMAAASNGDAETSTGTDIPSCTAAWFSPTVSSFPTANVPPGQTVQVQVTVTMPALNVDQSKCENATPAVQLTVG